MQVHHKLSHLDHLTDAEITAAIHYLDPDASRNRTGVNSGAILWPLFTALVGALAYIWLNQP